MNTEYVRYFIAACEYGSILEASKNLFISAQGLGAGIHRLEKSIGVELLDYTYSGVKPTDFGKEFYEQAVIACHEIDKLEMMAKDYAEKQRNTLTIGTIGHTKFYQCIQSGVQRYHQEHPDSEFEGKLVVRDEGTELINEVRTGSIDIGMGFNIRRYDELDYAVISPFSRLMLLINRDHPLAKNNVVKWEDLKDLHYVFPAPQDPFISLVNHLCAEYDFTPETIYYSTENSQNARFLDQNICAMFMRESYAKAILEFCNNTIMLPIEPEVLIECSIYWRKKNNFDSEKQQFLEEMIRYFNMVF